MHILLAKMMLILRSLFAEPSLWL